MNTKEDSPMTHSRCCTHDCNQGRDCPQRLWSRFEARAEAKPDAPYLRIVALMFTAAALMVWGVAT